jgi:anhydro-N-acetylmuramic acid kinase
VGFSNVSFMHKAKRIAFDISPVNTVLNHYAQKIGLQYDKGGKRSAEGKLHHGLLASLNDLNYYQKPWPKSLGIEWVNTSVIPLIDSYNLETADALRTFVEHIAVQIGNAIDSQSKVLVTGGGGLQQFSDGALSVVFQSRHEGPGTRACGI